MTKILVSLFFIASTVEAKVIEGIAVLWEKLPCLPNAKCELPKPIDQKRFFSFETTENHEPGTYSVTPVIFESKDFKIQIEFYSVVKENEKPYFISQVFLSHREAGLIAQCSQYSEIKITEFFPVGSCSGIYKDKQIGISFLKPTMSGK